MSDAAQSALPRSTVEVPIDDLAQQRRVRPIESIDDLAPPDSWESDDEFDDFLTDLYRSRRSDVS